MASSLATATLVAEVDISENKFGDEGKRALAAVMPSTIRKLQRMSLDLGYGTVRLAASNTELNLARKELTPADIMMVFLASWLSTDIAGTVLPFKICPGTNSTPNY